MTFNYKIVEQQLETQCSKNKLVENIYVPMNGFATSKTKFN